MRETAIALLVLLTGAACDDYVGPSAPGTAYALARIGPSRLPVPITGGPALLVADTLLLLPGRARASQALLTRVIVRKEGDGTTTRSESRHTYTFKSDLFTYDGCPFGALCIIDATQTFQAAGDSLFQVLPVAANIQPYVYGRVRSP